ncbi:MAG: LPS export ABC transporter permease LptG [Nitrosomonadales bacterium]|nr:LPS export ABC transporter permease LptG [Nitrosomonadales bacterium]
MSLLLRHLGREIYLSIGMIFFALVGLFAFMDFIHELGEMGKGEYHLGYVLLFVMLIIPGHIYELFPMAVLVGTILALVQMAASSELTVYRCSGVSPQRMIGILFLIAIPLISLSLVLGEFIVPPSDRMAQRLSLMARKGQVALKEFRSGVWVKDERSFVNVKDVILDSTLSNLSDVDIYRFDENYHLQAITNAKRASFITQGRWLLEEVRETQFSKEGVSIHAQPRMEWISALHPSIFSVLLVVPEQMSANELYQYSNHLKDNRQKSARYEIAMWNKLVYPFTLLVMLLLALPFASYHRRGGGVGSMIFLGILMGLVFHVVGRLFATLGALNDWHPFVSATAMTGLFLLMGTGMLWWTERR